MMVEDEMGRLSDFLREHAEGDLVPWRCQVEMAEMVAGEMVGQIGGAQAQRVTFQPHRGEPIGISIGSLKPVRAWRATAG